MEIYIVFSSRITRVAATEVRGSDSYMFCLMSMLVRTAVAYYGIYCEPRGDRTEYRETARFITKEL